MIYPKMTGIIFLVTIVLSITAPAAEKEFFPADKFQELVATGRIRQLCRERSTLNIPCGTLGGKMWWKTLEYKKWKLQFHKISGHWRILDPDNQRLAWGTTLSQLKKFLNDRPTSFLANYFDNGECFYRYPGCSDDTVILIHGWAVRAVSLVPFAEMLQVEGFNVLNYDYPTSIKNIDAHAETFLHKLRQEKISGKVYFLTHSMGGIILRHAIAKMDPQERQKIAAVVMLGPPNQGSFWAIPGKLILQENHSVADLIPGARPLKIRQPDDMPPLGIIAGTSDIIVPPDDTKLPDAAAMITKKCSHPGLRDPRNTGAEVLKFFRDKSF